MAHTVEHNARMTKSYMGCCRSRERKKPERKGRPGFNLRTYQETESDVDLSLQPCVFQGIKGNKRKNCPFANNKAKKITYIS